MLKGKYLVEGPLGKGGFGSVYKVIDTFGDVTRVLKIIATERDTKGHAYAPWASASGAALLLFSLSIAISFIGLLPDRVAVVTVITPVRRNIQSNLRRLGRLRRKSILVKSNWRDWSLSYRGRTS